MDTATVDAAAKRLWDAHESGIPCDPVRDLIGLSVEAGYAVQTVNTRRWLARGRRLVGRKIGLTSAAVQQQLGVDQPDFGMLFADMEYADGQELPLARTHQPKAEAEIALVVGKMLSQSDLTYSELVSAVEFVLPAIEVVGSRIRNWDIKISDTVADNASSGLYVLGGSPQRLHGLDLSRVGMVLKRNGVPLSYGVGAACLGNPLTAALWLARTCARIGTPLNAGDTILTGALGPMIPLAAGDSFEAEIFGLGSVRATVGSNK